MTGVTLRLRGDNLHAVMPVNMYYNKFLKQRFGTKYVPSQYCQETHYTVQRIAPHFPPFGERRRLISVLKPLNRLYGQHRLRGNLRKRVSVCTFYTVYSVEKANPARIAAQRCALRCLHSSGSSVYSKG